MKKPTLEEVQDYCLSRRNGIDPSAFLDYYDQVGWVVGKARKPMKDWQAAVRTWERSRNPQGQNIQQRLLDRTWAN